MEAGSRLDAALYRIDEFNSRDPRQEDGVPAELRYSERLTEWVLKLSPAPSEELRIAARGQHIGRWTIPRESYPMDRGGYLRWREELKRFHAATVGEIMGACGYPQPAIERTRSLILKKNLSSDPEAQTLEDALCLVFLETQFIDLRSKTPEEKMGEIVRKTWKKMSPQGRAAALALPIPESERAFLQSALKEAT